MRIERVVRVSLGSRVCSRPVCLSSQPEYYWPLVHIHNILCHLIRDDMVVPLVHEAPGPAGLALHLLDPVLQAVPGLDVALHQVRQLVVALLVRVLGCVLK